MKPLSERLKDFTASQFIDWLCLACVDVREVRTPVDAQEEINKIREAVTERISVLEHRAEAAEQKLAKAYNQPAIGRVDLGQVSDSNEYPNARVVCLDEHAGWENFQDGTELFLHSSPAINMAELVPEIEALRVAFEDVERQSDGGYNLHQYDTVYADDETQERWELWLSCRAAILRNIEEAK